MSQNTNTHSDNYDELQDSTQQGNSHYKFGSKSKNPKGRSENLNQGDDTEPLKTTAKGNQKDKNDIASGMSKGKNDKSLKGKIEREKEREEERNKERENTNNQKLKNTANISGRAAKMVSNAPSFFKGALLLKMLQLAKTTAIMLLTGLSSMIATTLGFFSGMWASIVVTFNAIASFFGSVAVAVVTVTVIPVVALAFIIGGIASVIEYDTVTKIGTSIDCRETYNKKVGQISEVDSNAQLIKNAEQGYSIMKTYGLSDEQIAGVIGNWSTESGIDPTTIEFIYNEDHDINGPQHKTALNDLDAFCKNDIFTAYDRDGVNYNKDGYIASDGKYYPGLGLVQYTGEGAKRFLDFAKQQNKNWWDFDFQLAYSFAKGSPTGFDNFWEKYKSEKFSTPEDAAMYFTEYFEGNTVNGISHRKEGARTWFEKIKDFKHDVNYGNSILALARELGLKSESNAIASASQDCVKMVGKYDNSSIAKAAVSLAALNKTEGRKDAHGTPLYRQLHDNIWKGATNYYGSCDVGVATAIRWSGGDDTFPLVTSTDQLHYMETSDKWALVGESTKVNYGDLMPGDVLSLDGHIFLFVGRETVKSFYPDLDFDSVSSSVGSDENGEAMGPPGYQAPSLGNDTVNLMKGNGGEDWIGRGPYYIYRLVKPDNSNRYRDAAGAKGIPEYKAIPN